MRVIVGKSFSGNVGERAYEMRILDLVIRRLFEEVVVVFDFCFFVELWK